MVTVLLLVVIGPVVVTRVRSGPTRRQLNGVSLGEIDFREVSFPNRVAGLQLGGMLLVPERSGSFPGVIIIQGSGSSSRNNRWYLTLARYLQKTGVVVLLSDKRGCERSEGDWRTASFEDLAGDTLAAITFLKSESNVAVSAVGVIGLSQGGDALARIRAFNPLR